jgi:hypothetical protein
MTVATVALLLKLPLLDRRERLFLGIYSTQKKNGKSNNNDT